MIRKILIIVLLSIVYCSGQVWEEPYVIDNGNEDIEVTVGSQTTIINMNEEIVPEFVLCSLNYEGTVTPTVNFQINTQAYLGLKIEKGEDNLKWNLVIDKKHDYEATTVGNRRSVILITIGAVSHLIDLNLINIFDNTPMIQYDVPCKFDELNEAMFRSSCIFTVTTLDGFIGNQITMQAQVESVRNLFQFECLNCEVAEADREDQKYELIIVEELLYVDRPFYSFITEAIDIAGNVGSVQTIVELNDLPNLPPTFTRAFGVQRYDEKQQKVFTVAAIDGDTGIDAPICFKLDWEANADYSEFITFQEADNTMTITVAPIDRDAKEQEIFNFLIIAYECEDEAWNVSNTALIIIDDINDNAPIISLQNVITEISIKEQTFLTLVFDPELFVKDIDLGTHATYSISLQQSQGEAFQIIPNRGYQTSSFIITVINTDFLDFDNIVDFPDHKVTITIRAEETESDEKLFDEKSLVIELLNWNDELPVFALEEYEASVSEMLGINEFIADVTATDRDVDDELIHEILGSFSQSFNIGKLDGKITTNDPNYFDFERQEEVYLQIRATDTLNNEISSVLHSAFARLKITVIDENDETPELRMPTTTPAIDENSLPLVVAATGIIARDPDTTADLVIHIDWENSFGTKAGQRAAASTFRECFLIKWDEAISTVNVKSAELIVNPDFFDEADPEKQIDYEMYELLYLTIVVEDKGQMFGEGTVSGVLTVNINDLNDNAPIFLLNTLTTERRVFEESDTGSLIGTILATDIDGPGNNDVVYAISAVQPEWEGWVQIDQSGVVEVLLDKAINCDIPKIDLFQVTIHLTDGVHDTYGVVDIVIIDTNNRAPVIQALDKEEYVIFEKQEFVEIVNIIANDADRDEMYHTLEYTIDQRDSTLRQYFQIDEILGLLVSNVTPGFVINRDIGMEHFDIIVIVEDNVSGTGGKHTASITVPIKIADINDNAPELPVGFTITISENAVFPVTLADKFCAPDIDDKTIGNGQVTYKIDSITPASGNSVPAPDGSNLLTLEDTADFCALFELNADLKGFYGSWNLAITASDLGMDDQLGQQTSSGVFTLEIDPYNYNTPVITFPTAAQTFRIDHEKSKSGSPLVTIEGPLLASFTATDPDGGSFGEVTFVLSDTEPESGDSLLFTMVPIDSKSSRIDIVTEIAVDTTYKLSVTAVDGGGLQSAEVEIILRSVDPNGVPYFTDSTFEISNLREDEIGVAEDSAQLPLADDPLNDGEDLSYFIIGSFNEDDVSYFALDKTTAILSVVKKMDRDLFATHTIKVLASRSSTWDETQGFEEASTILVTILVKDINNNPPIFNSATYGAGVTKTDFTEKALLTVLATDRDLNEVLRYNILGTVVGVGSNLADVAASTPFVLEEDTGILRLDFLVQDSMSGYFEFQIIVHDNDDLHSDVCDVKIYIVADSNRVTFLFFNTVAKIKEDENEAFIASVFEDNYGFQCNIDDVQPNSINGVIQSDFTNVRAHFIKDHVAIAASTIQMRSSDMLFTTKLQTDLIERDLILQDVPTNNSVDDLDNMEETLRIILIVVSVVLGTLCIVLIVAFIIRTQSLKRQLRALETTEDDFGSQSSNMNRQQKLPGINDYSVEGSNPVLNDNQISHRTFDTISVLSDESDFGGLDNDPTFTKNVRKESANPALLEQIRRKSMNPMAISNGDAVDITAPKY